MTEQPILSFTVLGKPQPRGSKRSIPIYRKGGEPVRRANGSILIATTDDNPKSKGFMQDVAVCCREAMEEFGIEMTDDPVRVLARFILTRPKGHHGSGKNSAVIKPGAPAFPDGKPDCGKLFRGLADAMTGVLYRDDGQIVNEEVWKEYGAPTRTEVSVFWLPATVGEILEKPA